MTTNTAEGLFLGLDVGTQSTKGILVEVNASGATIVARAAHAYDLLPADETGAAEQHPDTWRDAVAAVVKNLSRFADLERLSGIGVSGQQHGCVVLDEKQEIIRPAKLWCDTTTAAEAAEITQRSRYSVPAGFTLPKLLWMKRREPENWARLRTVLLPHDYINLLLSGEMFMEAGDASGSGAFDPVSRTFDEELLAWVDPSLPDMLPRLVPADAIAAYTGKSARDLFGLPEGVAISPGGGDNMMSAIGAGATGPGATVISLGTSGTAFAYAAQPVIDPDGAIAPFCDSTGAWLPLLCTMNVTGVTERIRKSFGGPTLEAMTRLAEAVDPGCNGLLMLPYLQGERVPNLPNATGALLGMRPENLTPGHFFRAAFEGTALGLVAGVERMKELGLEVSTVHLVGGGSKNRLWRQIFADALGVPVRVVTEPESAALGGAIQAAWVKRRDAGESVSIGDVAAPIVELAPERAEPTPALRNVYVARIEEMKERTSALFE